MTHGRSSGPATTRWPTGTRVHVGHGVRRTTFPGSDGGGGEEFGGHRLQRVVLRLDQNVHRPRLCAAIVDRLTFCGNIIEAGTQSFRLSHVRPNLLPMALRLWPAKELIQRGLGVF